MYCRVHRARRWISHTCYIFIYMFMEITEGQIKSNYQGGKKWRQTNTHNKLTWILNFIYFFYRFACKIKSTQKYLNVRLWIVWMSPELGILELKTQYKTRTQNKCLSLFVRLSTGNQYTVFFLLIVFYYYYCCFMSVDWYSIESSSIFF